MLEKQMQGEKVKKLFFISILYIVSSIKSPGFSRFTILRRSLFLKNLRKNFSKIFLFIIHLTKVFSIQDKKVTDRMKMQFLGEKVKFNIKKAFN